MSSTQTGAPLIPFHTYLWKAASRCNLNCSYCYVYNLADAGWRDQPILMSERTARQTAIRMRQHLESHAKDDAVIVFHGGEPLFGGVNHLRKMVEAISDVFDGSGVNLAVGVQSNLLLFTPEIGDYMLDTGISIGVSLDGPPEINDIHRVDRVGRPTGARLEAKLALLTSPRYRPIFSGFLCVINKDTDPVNITEYLLSYDPPGIDFLLPLDNHDRRPPGKEGHLLNATPYGDWLIKSFDYWMRRPNRTQIRYFMSIIRMLCGAPTLVESLGLHPVDLVVVETNGDIEAVDSLKSTFDGATKLGFNVFENDFDTVASHIGVRTRQIGAQSLCQKCRECSVVNICGGGYLPHRYSAERGFDNPSVYSADIEKLIRHIHAKVSDELRLVRVGGSHEHTLVSVG